MKNRISEKEVKELYQKYNTPPHVIRHCRAVANAGVKIAKALNEHGYNFDIDLIMGAGLAHDVARVQEEHARVGAEILDGLGYKDEADIVRVHMNYTFNDIDHLNECDMVCLGDCTVKEDEYVGLDDRMAYVLNKVKGNERAEQRILEKKSQTKKILDKIEEIIGQSIDSLFL